MPLSPGARLGVYEVTTQIGAGGMGEVYRATDTNLKRSVAIKVLPASVAADSERLARFQREAEVLAALNHPNIAAIYGLEKASDLTALVMELVEGDDLSSRIARGAIPIAEALPIAKQLADALDAAHEQNIIHRDLKPANIKIRPDGTVKVLDFGLAKALDPVGTARVDAINSPTITAHATQMGMILGTAAYMAPEQARGRAVDKRTDIWAFGVVLYEMLTGRRAFEGDDISEVVASVLKTDPDLSVLPADVPPSVRRLLRRCLQKDPRKRLSAIGDARLELDEMEPAAPEVRTTAVPVRRSIGATLGPAVAGIVLTAAVAAALWPRPVGPPTESVRFSVTLPESVIFTSPRLATVSTLQFALAPDGRCLAFVAGRPADKPTLWLRYLDDVEARPVPGTEDAQDPFWSPDGRWIGFFAEGDLKKAAVAGGLVQTVARDVLDPRGASWGPDDTILFGTGDGAIARVAAAGGTPRPVTRLDASKDEGSHRWPHFLPDGRRFLFTARSGRADSRGLYVGTLNDETRHQLLRLESNAHYVAAGSLVFLDGDTLLAQPFDSDRLVLSGQPTPLAARIGRSSRGNGAFSTSRTGTIAYAGSTLRTGRLTWFDRNGSALSTVGPNAEHDYVDFRLSRDDTRLVASLVDPKLSLPDIWLFDLARGAASRLTFGPLLNAGTVWAPQGDRMAFRTNRKGGMIEFYQMSAVESGNGEPLLPNDMARRAGVSYSSLTPTDWSSDGQHLAFTTGQPADIWLLRIADPSKPVRVVASQGDQMHGNFSPDGSAIAYTSNESGRFEVYVQSLRPPARKLPISVNGGYEPRWRADGKELYYLADDQTLMAVAVSSAAAPFGVPRPLFRTQVHQGVSSLRTHYVPNRDGSRFLLHRRTHDVAPASITIVLNGLTALKP